MSHRRIAGMVLSMLMLMGTTGCAQKQETAPDYRAEAEALYQSCAAKEDCCLCGSRAVLYWEHLGENNVGIVSLNTFQMLPVAINRYDDAGKLIEENTGCMESRRLTCDEDGFRADLMLDADRGVANAQLTFNGDQQLRLERTAQHLCEEHFRELVSDLYGNPYGVGIVDLKSGKLYPFKENVIAFQAGDYYIHCDLTEADRDGNPLKMSVYVVYTPLRYGNEKAE